jgi:predicted nucleotidyltransferase
MRKSLRVDSGGTTTELTIAEMRMAIQSLPIGQLGVKRIYGFGSFFRSGEFSDVDLVVIVWPVVATSVGSYYLLKNEFERVGRDLCVPIDLTVLTEEEFETRPLRDMHELILLHATKSVDERAEPP